MHARQFQVCVNQKSVGNFLAPHACLELSGRYAYKWQTVRARHQIERCEGVATTNITKLHTILLMYVLYTRQATQGVDKFLIRKLSTL